MSLLEESATRLLFLWVCVMDKIQMLTEEHLNQLCIREIDVSFVPPFFNWTH